MSEPQAAKPTETATATIGCGAGGGAGCEPAGITHSDHGFPTAGGMTVEACRHELPTIRRSLSKRR